MEEAGPAPVWQIKSEREISAVEVSPEEPGVPAPHHGPQPRVPEPGRDVPTTSSCENQQGLRPSDTEGCCSPTQFLVKGRADSSGPALSEPQQCASSAESARDTWGGRDCQTSGQELEGTLLPGRSAGRGHSSFSGPHRPQSQLVGHTPEPPSVWLMLFAPC